MPIAIIAAFIVGVAVTTVGLRDRRIDAHPLCRRCGFDLTGRAPDSTRCPECGGDLGRRRAIVVGHRRRRRGMLLAGAALVATSSLLGGSASLQWARQYNWLRLVPVFYLVGEASSVDPARRTPALLELTFRLSDRRISGRSLNGVMHTGLGLQGDPLRAWDPS